MRLIEAEVLKEAFEEDGHLSGYIEEFIDDCPTVDAVPVADVEAWLYQIAMNNTGNPLSAACVEIINRLEGLRQFSRERSCKDGN